MKKTLFLFALLGLLFAGAEGAMAVHYGIGGEGPKAATMPGQGFHYKMYNTVYTAKVLKDKNGKKAPGKFHADVFNQSHRFIYVSDIDILGGKLSMDVSIPLVYNNMSYHGVGPYSYDDNRFGVGDTNLEPFIISWHGPQYDAVAGLAIMVPTGDYQKNNGASTGAGYWSFLPSAGITYYFDKERKWSGSILARYETSTHQQNSSFRAGDFILAEYGFGRNFLGKYDVSISGYNSAQVTDSKGQGAANSHYEYKNAIGPELGMYVESIQSYITAKVLFDYENRNTTQGTTFMFTLFKSF